MNESDKTQPSENPSGSQQENFGEGNKSETVKQIEQLRAETEELDRAFEQKKNAEARARIAGITNGPKPEEKQKDPKEKAREYANNIMKGKLNNE